MAINPPEGIADFLGFVSGMEWPEADEDLMRRVSEHYGSIARDLETLSGYVVELIPIVKNDFDGEAANSFLMAMNDLTGQTAGANQLGQTADLSRQLSEVALKVANQVEYMKITAILQLVQLLAEILFATLFSVFTFGSVWGPVSAMFAATREGIHHLFRWLLQTILSQTFIGIAGGIFQDTVIQLYQLGAGHTTSWNTESLIDSIKQGALTGLVGGPLEVVFHYGGKLLGRLLGGRTPGSIISKRLDDVLNKADDDLGNVPKNKTPDVPTDGAGPKSKLDDTASKTDKELPPTPVNRTTDTATPPPVPPKTATEGVTPPPATRRKPDTATAPGKAKPEAPGGATAKDKPNAPTTGRKDAPAAGTKDVPTTGKPETVGGKDAPGAGKSATADAPTTGSKSSGSSAAGRTAGDTENPLDGLLATKEARSDFAKDVGELLGGVTRQLETGFLRFGEGTIANAFADKMGDVFAKHLAHEGAEAAGREFGEMLARKWVRLGADHAELPELLTKAMGELGQLAPLKNLADAMPDLFARSEHSNALARIFKQENPLQGSPMYQLGGAVASLLSEGTHEMLSEGFYNLFFGDGTFKVTAGPFAAGVAMGALSHGLHRMFEPVMVKYQNWILSHQYAENTDDNKYFGLLHPLNIASFVANMTGSSAPWPVPRPTSDTPDPNFAREMKDMVKWVFSNPFTGTPFFADAPHQPDVKVESDGDGAAKPLDVDLGPSFADEIADDPLFRTESDGDTSTDGGTTKDGGKEEGSDTETVSTPSQATVSSDLSSLLGDDAEGRTSNRTDEDRPTDQDRPTAHTVTQSSGDQFAAPVPKAAEDSTEARAGVPGAKPHPLQADADKAAAEGLDYLLFDVEDAGTPAGDAPAQHPAVVDDAGPTPTVGDDDNGATPPHGPVRDIPSGISVGTLTPAQTTALHALPKRPGVFVVGMHTDPHTPHHPATVLKALTDAHDSGNLDGITEIQFTACNLASPVHETTVKTVMSGLWKHRADDVPPPGPLKAVAANAPVWYVPGGRLVTAADISVAPDGKLSVRRDDAAWHEYADSGAPDHTPDLTTTRADDLPVSLAPGSEAIVAFGTGGATAGPLSQHLPQEHWGLLLSDLRWSDVLEEVADRGQDPGGDWHTMNADAYGKLLARVPDSDRAGLSDDDITEAFDNYGTDVSSAGDDRGRLEAIAGLVKGLQGNTADGALTPVTEILVQRLLLDQGFPPARLSPEARTTEFWQNPVLGVLAGELALGMADLSLATAHPSPVPDTTTAPPAPLPPEDALPRLLAGPDENMTGVLRDLLDGAHTPGSAWHTLNADTYLALLGRIEGTGQESPEHGVRSQLDAVFAKYETDLAASTGRMKQLEVVADAVLALHQVTGLTTSTQSALTAHTRFVVPRMLLDLGLTPVPLPGKLHAETAWKKPRIPSAKATRLRQFATDVAMATVESSREWSRSVAPADGGAGDAARTGDPNPDDGQDTTTGRRAGDDVRPTGTGASTTADGPTAGQGDVTRDGWARGGDEDAADGPKDWRAELDALGTRTREDTTAYLELPDAPVRLVGLADRHLRTRDEPYATLTRELPPNTTHWLAVRIPAGRAVDTGDGRLLVGKDQLAAVTVTGPADQVDAIQRFQQGLHTPNSPYASGARPLPLTVLTRVGQALHANPDRTEHHAIVRAATRIAYAEASRAAERPLGEYIAQLPEVQQQVRELVKALWDKTAPEDRHKLGSPGSTGSGSVGTHTETLRQVVEKGNIREQMHLLATAVHSTDLARPLGLAKKRPAILEREWGPGIQQDADVVQLIEQDRQRLMQALPEGPERDALVASLDLRRRTELAPDDVVPPLSDRERAHALDGDRLTWEPGERHRQIALKTESQVTAEGTGGLMSAGTSNTTYFTLAFVHAMATKWGVPVDYRLVRSALLADMLPIGHHTFHEIMTAADAFEKDVLSGRKGHTDVLGYTDDWSRFRSLAPLTEASLRSAMPGGRFPDEVALGLEAGETVPVDPRDRADVPLQPSPRSARMLHDRDLAVLLAGTPGLNDRTAQLMREALGEGTGSRDWRRSDAGSYLELRRRIEQPDDAGPDDQIGVRDEVTSIMERFYLLDPDDPDSDSHPAPDPVRDGLDTAFDRYYDVLSTDPGDRVRLTALVDLVKTLQGFADLPASSPGTGITADVRILVPRLLVDQGYPPALLGEDGHTPEFWGRDTSIVVDELSAGMGEFILRQPVRGIPSGIAVGGLSPAQARALAALRPQPNRFVVGMHTGDDGAPRADLVLTALIDAHDDSRLDGVTEIQFTGCGLAALHDATVREVMSGLWKHRAQGGAGPDSLTALAADAPVWSVPGGSLVTARHVGVTADGKITVSGDDASWHRYTDLGTDDHTAESTSTRHDGAPDHAVRDAGEGTLEHPGAVRFGEEDDSSLTVLFGPGGEPSTPRTLTLRFPEGGKSLGEDQRGQLDDFAARLLPELERRHLPREGKLTITVTAGGNNRIPAKAAQAATERVNGIVDALTRSIENAAGGPDAAQRLVDKVDFDRRPRGLSVKEALTPSGASQAESRRQGTVSSDVRTLTAYYEEAQALQQLVGVDIDASRLALVIGHAKGDGVLRDLAQEPDQQVAKAIAEIQEIVKPYRHPVQSGARIPADRLAGLRELADARTAHPLSDLVPSVPGWTTRRGHESRPGDNVVFEVQPLVAWDARKVRGGDRIVFTPGSHYEVKSVTRAANGQSLVKIREVDPQAAVGSERGPSRPADRNTPAIGVPGMSYPGPSRPTDPEPRWSNKRYAFETNHYVHRGEVEVEVVDGAPYVRFYTAVVEEVALEITPGVRGRATSAENHKDVQQDPATGQVLLCTGQGDTTMWTSIGTPARAIAWGMKYKAEHGEGKEPLIRSYLVPQDTYHRITRAAVHLDSPEGSTDRKTTNVDHSADRNQFGIRGTDLTLLRENILPNSLITYFDGPKNHLSEDEDLPGHAFQKHGEHLHVNELRDRLGIPESESRELSAEFNPWIASDKVAETLDTYVKGKTHQNSESKLHWISRKLRQHYVTWEHLNQRPVDRVRHALQDDDIPYAGRERELEKFLAKHEDLLDVVNPAPAEWSGRYGPESVDRLMHETVLVWATHAAIALELARQDKAAAADLNVTETPVAQDFAAMRQERAGEVARQIRVGTELTGLRQEDQPVFRMLDLLKKEFPELNRRYDVICAANEEYTFYQHAQMVAGQYLKLVADEREGAARLVPVDAVVKSIFFHDIEKLNSKAMYGDGKDAHDNEPEHRGAVELMSRYRHLWGDMEDEVVRFAFKASLLMVDSDPLGFYYRGKTDHKDTFQWIAEAALKLTGKPVMTTEGARRRLVDLGDRELKAVRQLFHEFHQYYQADLSSYTSYSVYHDEGERRVGKPSFNKYFEPPSNSPDDGEGSTPGRGPKLAEEPVSMDPADGDFPAYRRFLLVDKSDGNERFGYEKKYRELAAMFADNATAKRHFEEIGTSRLRAEAGRLGDTDNARQEQPEPVAQESDEDDEDMFGALGFGGAEGHGSPASPHAAPAPASLQNSADRVDELVVAITRSRQENDTRHLIDPATVPDEAEQVRGAIGRFPRDERFFTLASHVVGSDGAPTWRGQRVTAGELGAVLSGLADDGVWDTAKPLQFAACGVGGELERSYAADTLRALRELRPDLPLTAYAPRSTLWFVPRVTGPFATDATSPGHTTVARKVVWDADGRPRVEPDHWVRLSLPVGEDAVVEATVLGAHMPPDGQLPSDAVPETVPAPDGYLIAQDGSAGNLPDAVPFRTPTPLTVTAEPPAGAATPDDAPQAPPSAPYRLGDYEAGGTTWHTWVGETRVEVVADEVDPIARALNGTSGDAASFPLYRPVRPVESVQRPTLQVSADHRFALPDHGGRVREFYATPDAVQEARADPAASGGIRLAVDPESYVRFTRDGVEHTLHRFTVQGAPAAGSVAPVLAGDPQGHHLTLRDGARAGQRDADMWSAVEANLAHYGSRLNAIAGELERSDPERMDGPTVLARALADLWRAREEGGDPGASARAEAVRAFAAAAGEGYGSPDDDWYVHLGTGAVLTLPTVDWSF